MILSFSLLCGTAGIAQAQTAAPLPPPPLSTSSPYGSGGRGVYVLPGTYAPSKAKSLPALPRKAAPAPKPSAGAGALPSPRQLSAPLSLDSPNPRNHRAETPATLRYVRPAQPVARPYYPAPVAPAPVTPSPRMVPQTTPAPMPMEPQTTVTTAPPRIPFGAPSAPRRTEPQVTVEKAIPVAPQWQEPQRVPTPPPPAPVPALPPAAPPPPVAVMPRNAVMDEFNALTRAPEPLFPEQQPMAPVAVPPLPPVAESPAPLQPQAEQPIFPEQPFPAQPQPDMPPLTAVEPVRTQELSEESLKILDATPSGIDSKTVIRSPKPVIIKRVDPNAGLIPDMDVRAHEEMGMKIEIRQPNVNIQGYLEEGYNNLVNGREAIAAGYYQQALDAEPNNEDALFGLATTSQRLGRMEEARELYGRLLAQNPTHREGLNNFMVLISKEAPEAAIEELEQLETENPDFSPIPAQLGIIYNRLGNPQMAARKLARALHLSPDNLSYKYNLAITLDKLGQVEEASDLYLELIEAYNAGATLPGDVEDLRNRVVFINSKR